MSRYDEFGDMWDLMQPGERRAFLKANGMDVLLAHLCWGDLNVRYPNQAERVAIAFYGTEEALH